MEQLKSCPFCGGEVMIEVIEPHTHTLATFMPDCEGKAFVECQCGAAIGGETRDAAIAAWNRRAEQNPQPLTIEELQEFIDFDEEDNAIWIKNMEYDYFTRALLDWDRDRGIFAIWHGDKNTSDFPIEKDYGKTWLAYRTRPEGSGEE